MFPRSWQLCALAVPPLAWCSLAGCVASDLGASGDAGGGGVSPEGAAAPDGSQAADSGAADANTVVEGAASDSGIVQDDAPPGCPGPVTGAPVSPPVGRLLAAGNSLSTRGMTSDGYEIYSDDFALALYAIPVAGGARQSIASLGSNFWVTVVGQVVFAWSNVTPTNVGSLTIWSSAHGAQTILDGVVRHSRHELSRREPDPLRRQRRPSGPDRGRVPDAVGRKRRDPAPPGSAAHRLLSAARLRGLLRGRVPLRRGAGRGPFGDDHVVPRAGVDPSGSRHERPERLVRGLCRDDGAGVDGRRCPRRSHGGRCGHDHRLRRISWDSSSQGARRPSTARPPAPSDAPRPPRRRPPRSRPASQASTASRRHREPSSTTRHPRRPGATCTSRRPSPPARR